MYTPARTHTLVLWLLGLALAVFGGLVVGHQNSSYALGPEFGPYPTYQYSSPNPIQSIGGSTSLNNPDLYSSETPATTQSSFEPCEETDKNGRCVELIPVVTTVQVDKSKEAAGHMSGSPKRSETPVLTAPQPSEKPAAELSAPVQATPSVPSLTPPAVTEPAPISDPQTDISPAPIEESVVCEEGEAFDPEFGCVRTQLPEEIIGREVEGPNGEPCVVVDVDGNLDCTVREDVLVD